MAEGGGQFEFWEAVCRRCRGPRLGDKGLAWRFAFALSAEWAADITRWHMGVDVDDTM